MLIFRNLDFVCHVTSIAMLFYFRVQNFTEIGQSAAELWPKIFLKRRQSAILNF